MSVARQQRGLTPRSRRGPTAKHRARLPALSIIRPAGPALRRRPRLTSNVRRRLRTQCFRARAQSVALAVATAHEDASLRRRAAAASWPAIARFGLVQRGRAPQRSALSPRGFGASPVRVACLRRSAVLRLGAPTASAPFTMPPNPSVEARPNGGPPGPPPGCAYHPSGGPGVPPSAPPHLER